jgi:hypothetical protein
MGILLTRAIGDILYNIAWNVAPCVIVVAMLWIK